MKINPDLSVVSEVENDDTDLTADASKTNEEDDNINILEKENHNTVQNQETLKIYIKNIDKTLIQYRDQYMKLSMLRSLKKRKFPTSFLDL